MHKFLLFALKDDIRNNSHNLDHIESLRAGHECVRGIKKHASTHTTRTEPSMTARTGCNLIAASTIYYVPGLCASAREYVQI